MKSSQSSRRKSYRTDIDGLRGLAIALVVFFHAFVGRVSSGVDVFLFIGGIFFFAPQIRSALSGTSLTIVQALIRLFRRLFPDLVAVLCGSLLLVWCFYSNIRWGDVGKDAIASLLYIQNFNLAAAGRDYAAISSDVSIFQHIWSMSVQLQIYVGSLAVITLLAFILRGKPWARKAFFWLLVAATAFSFVMAVVYNRTDQGWNYYSPLTRFWEIGLGGLFGMKFIQTSVSVTYRAWRLPAGIVGLCLIGFTGLFLNGAQQFPGPLTLIPLAGAALVIWSCNPEKVSSSQQEDTAQDGVHGTAKAPLQEIVQDYRGGVAAMLRSPIPQFLGRISYPLYLWHWPLLAVATYVFAGGGVRINVGGAGITATLGFARGMAVGVAVIALSILLAWLTLIFVEKPTRQKTKPQRSWVLFDVAYLKDALRRFSERALGIVLTASCTAVVLGGGVWMQDVSLHSSQVPEQSEFDLSYYPGPLALLNGQSVSPQTPLPLAQSSIEEFYPQSAEDGCTAAIEDTELILAHNNNGSSQPCVYGDTDSDRTMYLFGNSHADHFLPALDVVGHEFHIKIILLVKMSCYPGGGAMRTDGTFYPECKTWVDKAMQYILQNPPPDGVLMVSTRPDPGTQGPERSPEGLRTVVETFTAQGIKV